MIISHVCKHLEGTVKCTVWYFGAMPDPTKLCSGARITATLRISKVTPATVNQTISCFDAGDLVQFEVYHEAKLRKALNPKVVRSKADADLPNKLLRHSAGITRKQTGGEVLPFRPKAAPPVEFRHRGQA